MHNAQPDTKAVLMDVEDSQVEEVEMVDEDTMVDISHMHMLPMQKQHQKEEL